MPKKFIYTSGIFDLLHAGHVDTIMRILDKAKSLHPDCNLIIGVNSDSYDESFKRVPYQSQSERMKSLDTIFKRFGCEVISDPLKSVDDVYTKEFYDSFNIVAHYQGSDFPENPECYKLMKSAGSFITVGRSELMSTTKLIEATQNKYLEDLGGASNVNLRHGNIIIKELLNPDYESFDKIYNQLVENQLFGVTTYSRKGNLAILPYIEGEVTHDISKSELMNLIVTIQSSPIVPPRSIKSVFSQYGFSPSDEYNEILDTLVLSHGDLVYTNIVRTKRGLVVIDWEYCCSAPRYWDLCTFNLSQYLYGHVTRDSLLNITSSVEKLTLKLLVEYWIAWSQSTGIPYFNNKLLDVLNQLK